MNKLNFSIAELCASDTARKYNISNTPNIQQADNMMKLIVYCLQPIRDKLGKAMNVSSGFRCPALNQLVHGVSNSQHLEGKAIDFTVSGMNVAEVVNFIKNSGIEYDQLINEYNRWTHISYNHGSNRKQVLKYS